MRTSLQTVVLLSTLAIAYGAVIRDTFDPDKPKASVQALVSDPKQPPKDRELTRRDIDEVENPFKDGFKTAPASCSDPFKPSKQCMRELQAQPQGVVTFGGGELKWDTDHQCSSEQMGQFDTAAYNAYSLAVLMNKEPDAHLVKDVELWQTYIGPDYMDYQKRIADNFQRASEFKTTKNYDILLSCRDVKGWCNIKRNRMSVGGYAWTWKGRLNWYTYHQIVMCPPFFTTPSLAETRDMIRGDLDRGDDSKARDANWHKNTGQAFLHEMMHLDAVGDPKIIDELVNPSEGTKVWAYKPKFVNMLAKRARNQGGGASRSSTNADSYAWLANSKYFQEAFERFPNPNYRGATEQSSDFWVQDHEAFPIHIGQVNEDTSDDDIQGRLNDLLSTFDIQSGPAPKPGRALNIILMTTQASAKVGGAITHRWRFYTTPKGQGVVCGEDVDGVQEINPRGPSSATIDPKVDKSELTEKLPWPAGTFKLNIEGEECEYKCDGTNPGRLFCTQREIECKPDAKKGDLNDINECGSSAEEYRFAVSCTF